MNEENLLDEAFCLKSNTMDVDISFKQQPRIKYDANLTCENHSAAESSNPIGNLCEVFSSSSLHNINAKQAWKNGTGKLSQTLNHVRTTFGVLSQRIKKSTRKRQPLINVESPRSPVTPCTRSRAVLGRTPTKLYSPFSIDTPTGKENKWSRCVKNENHSSNSNANDEKKYLRRTKLDLKQKSYILKKKTLSTELLQTQIANYEFQYVAKKIVQNDLNN